MEDVTLYSYWRSSTAWRVRIALAWHGVAYTYAPVDLVAGAQRAASYVAHVHPGGLVPALTATLRGERIVATQSLAIIDLIESCAADGPRLLPRAEEDVVRRTRVLEVVYAIACDTHPLQNLRVLCAVSEDAAVRTAHARDVITRGLTAVEALIVRFHSRGECEAFDAPSGEMYSVPGDAPTLADACLVPQVYNARRFGVDVDALFPHIAAVDRCVSRHPAFVAAHPNVQPDAKA